MMMLHSVNEANMTGDVKVTHMLAVISRREALPVRNACRASAVDSSSNIANALFVRVSACVRTGGIESL